MMNFHNTNQQGFSLVETLVAITILLVVITGPLTLVSNSARSTNFANDQVVAFFLAQEGLEIAQSARDDLLLPTFSGPYSGTPAWDLFVDASSAGDYEECFNGGCGLDLNTDSDGTINVADCSSGTANCRLYIDNDNDQRAKYTHTSSAGDASKFTRTITMTETPGQVEVISLVTWRSDGQRAIQEVEAATYLFDVYGR